MSAFVKSNCWNEATACHKHGSSERLPHRPHGTNVSHSIFIGFSDFPPQVWLEIAFWKGLKCIQNNSDRYFDTLYCWTRVSYSGCLRWINTNNYWSWLSKGPFRYNKTTAPNPLFPVVPHHNGVLLGMNQYPADTAHTAALSSRCTSANWILLMVELF